MDSGGEIIDHKSRNVSVNFELDRKNRTDSGLRFSDSMIERTSEILRVRMQEIGVDIKMENLR